MVSEGSLLHTTLQIYVMRQWCRKVLYFIQLYKYTSGDNGVGRFSTSYNSTNTPHETMVSEGSLLHTTLQIYVMRQWCRNVLYFIQLYKYTS